uniref:Uncharacterized protein n=1 Tax=Hanusia phi TaxID=3032 RepID=A0A7S0F0D1_9CRYP
MVKQRLSVGMNVKGQQQLALVCLLACCAAMFFTYIADNTNEPTKLGEDDKGQSFLYWSDATAKRGQIVYECWDGLKTNAKTSMPCEAANSLLSRSVNQKTDGPGGSMPVSLDKGYLASQRAR